MCSLTLPRLLCGNPCAQAIEPVALTFSKIYTRTKQNLRAFSHKRHLFHIMALHFQSLIFKIMILTAALLSSDTNACAQTLETNDMDIEAVCCIRSDKTSHGRILPKASENSTFTTDRPPAPLQVMPQVHTGPLKVNLRIFYCIFRE